MPIAADTSADADAVQLEAYRSMGGAARVEVMFRLTRMAREVSEAGIRRRHPEYGDARVRIALARLIYGDTLVGRIWADSQLVDP